MDMPSRCDIKKPNGCLQNGAEHLVVQHTRGIHTDAEETNGSHEVHQDGTSNSCTVDTHMLVSGKVTEIVGTVVGELQVGEVEGCTICPIYRC